jgi:hypothetical protein
MSDTESEYEDDVECCVRCGYDCGSFTQRAAEAYRDELYCRDNCVHVVVKEDAKTMTFNELCNCDTLNVCIYSWLYDCDEETLCESVETISNWWLTQRKKMFKKPTKTTNKNEH